MIYLLFFTALLLSIENLTNATEEMSWQMLFELINNEL
jgi:hypothetical protein